MLHLLVFAIRFHLHQLIAKLRETPLLKGDIFLGGAPCGLVFAEPLFGGSDFGPRGFEARVERFLAIRLLRQSPLGVLSGRVEPLQRDDAFEIGVHQLAFHSTSSRLWRVCLARALPPNAPTPGAS